MLGLANARTGVRSVGAENKNDRLAEVFRGHWAAIVEVLHAHSPPPKRAKLRIPSKKHIVKVNLVIQDSSRN